VVQLGLVSAKELPHVSNYPTQAKDGLEWGTRHPAGKTKDPFAPFHFGRDDASEFTTPGGYTNSRWDALYS